MRQQYEFRYEPLTDGVAVVREVTPAEHFYNVYVLGGKGSAALVDAGMPDAADGLIAALQRNGWTPGDVRYIIITHEHLDHYGGASALKDWAGSAELLAHVSAAWAMSRQPSPFVGPGRSCGEPAKDRSARFDAAQPPAVRADGLLWDGDDLRVSGVAWRVLHVPGHSAGQILLYEEARRIAIVGDLIQGAVAARGWLGLFTDIRSQRKSLERLAELGAALVLMGHHQPLQGEAIAENIHAAAGRLDDLVRVVSEGLKAAAGDVGALARLAFREIFGSEPDPPPAYALQTIQAVLSELASEGLVTLERTDRWRWVGD